MMTKRPPRRRRNQPTTKRRRKQRGTTVMTRRHWQRPAGRRWAWAPFGSSCDETPTPLATKKTKKRHRTTKNKKRQQRQEVPIGWSSAANQLREDQARSSFSIYLSAVTGVAQSRGRQRSTSGLPPWRSSRCKARGARSRTRGRGRKRQSRRRCFICSRLRWLRTPMNCRRGLRKRAGWLLLELELFASRLIDSKLAMLRCLAKMGEEREMNKWLQVSGDFTGGVFSWVHPFYK
mmetsp:Transcript_30877/g.92544  ORF Transcript_30877/g.92544 Transcript_30877/m.92544 type:complete len:234 (+) Transcript_30877:1231-1932(+)